MQPGNFAAEGQTTFGNCTAHIRARCMSRPSFHAALRPSALGVLPERRAQCCLNTFQDCISLALRAATPSRERAARPEARRGVLFKLNFYGRTLSR